MPPSRFIRAEYRPSPKPEPPPTQWGWHNVTWGLREGWWFAKRYLAWSIVVIVFGGLTALKQHRLTLLGIAVTYGLGIPSIGAIVGALRPLCQSSLGAALVGMVAMIPMTFFVGFMVLPRSLSLGVDFTICLGLSIVYGGVGGLYLKGVYNR